MCVWWGGEGTQVQVDGRCREQTSESAVPTNLFWEKPKQILSPNPERPCLEVGWALTCREVAGSPLRGSPEGHRIG